MKLASRKPSEVTPPRMGALSKLPIFLDLNGKRVVVAGGSSAAAWKAELLAAAGADVAVFAANPSEEMCNLAARGAAQGRIVLNERCWSADVLAGTEIAICSDCDDAEAEAFTCAASASGALVNAIDKPAFCQFQFGSIVNRSPVVISVSTDGAAPILGQAIRQRIETLLPASLGDWGRLAAAIRSMVMQRLAKGAPRRAFWDRFAAMALERRLSTDPERDINRLITDASLANPKMGRVTLVGAGPGDAELLTLKAVRALQSADVILFDDLVSGEVLELARREAKRMIVGKRGGRESCRQQDINDLMIKLARQGKHVVRLKSGDPMIFGRAGEEIAKLDEAGIAVAVVPGITAASAMASRLGVSLTHRDHAQSVRFLTGHARSGELPDTLDWDGLADPCTTLVVYMGGRTASAMAARLHQHGLPLDTPLAVMAGACTDSEMCWTGNLGMLVDGRTPIDTGQPVLLGIGRVFKRSDSKCAKRAMSGENPHQDPRCRDNQLMSAR